MNAPIVGVVMGSDSDWTIMSDAAQALKEFGIEYEVEVLSAHRTPDRMMEWGKACRQGIESHYCWCWWCSSPTGHDCLNHDTALLLVFQ